MTVALTPAERRCPATGWTAAELLDHPQLLNQRVLRDSRDEPGHPRTPRPRVMQVIRSDTVVAPFRRGGGGLFTNLALDHCSRMSEFTVCAVAIDRADVTDPDPEGETVDA